MTELTKKNATLTGIWSSSQSAWERAKPGRARYRSGTARYLPPPAPRSTNSSQQPRHVHIRRRPSMLTTCSCSSAIGSAHISHRSPVGRSTADCRIRWRIRRAPCSAGTSAPRPLPRFTRAPASGSLARRPGRPRGTPRPPLRWRSGDLGRRLLDGDLHGELRVTDDDGHPSQLPSIRSGSRPRRRRPRAPRRRRRGSRDRAGHRRGRARCEWPDRAGGGRAGPGGGHEVVADQPVEELGTGLGPADDVVDQLEDPRGRRRRAR